MNQRELAEALRAVRAGDLERYERVIEHFWPRVAAYVGSTGVRGADLEDLVENVFIRAWRSVHRLKGYERFPAWLYTIAANQVRDHFRKRKREERKMTGYQAQLRTLAYVYVIPPWLFYAAAVTVLWRYPINELRLRKLRAALEKREKRQVI